MPYYDAVKKKKYIYLINRGRSQKQFKTEKKIANTMHSIMCFI